jgi:ATP-dependent Clp protease ATP-binding subunit ClpA
MPSQILKTVNWSAQLLQENSSAIEGRRSTLDAIARTLITSGSVKTHAMLLGKTGVGKTQTALAFAQAVQRGDYPGLRGKKVFYLNAAELVGANQMFSMGNQTLAHIKEAMGRHRDQIILVIDEIHLACQQREGSALSDQLKTLLDPTQEGFPYVIGITTEEEFLRDIYLVQSAFARRFKQIAVENTDQEETIRILTTALAQKAPDVLVQPATLQTFYKKVSENFPNAAAPATYLQILSQCIERVSASQKSSLETDIEALSDQLRSIQATRSLGQGSALLPYDRQEEDPLPELRANIQRKKEELERQTQPIAELFFRQKELRWVKPAIYASVLKVAQSVGQTLNEKDTQRFLLLSHFLGPSLVNGLREQGQRLSVKVEMDEELIEAVIAEEKRNRERAIEAVRQGQLAILARQESLQVQGPEQ